MKKEAAVLCVVYAFVMAWNGVRKLECVEEEFIKGEIGMKSPCVDGRGKGGMEDGERGEKVGGRG
ncbi:MULTISPECIES: hypothetical protein [unclassified Bartonella]|uniref:hypothetical protein n=1 Tax=unclassified Bartonella TaxID=2645622 RepID=UPI0035CF9DCB